MTRYNNTLVGNKAPQGGSGVLVTDTAQVLLSNCIIWNNPSANGTEVWVADEFYGPAGLTLQHCDLDGGQPSVTVEPGCSLIWGLGMINADPLFVDQAICDLHISYPSPCRDAGLLLFGMPATDFEDDPRAAGPIDIGADEFYTHLYYTGDAQPGGTVHLDVIDQPTGNPVLLWGLATQMTPAFPMPPFGEWHLGFPVFLNVGLGALGASGALSIPAAVPTTSPPGLSIYLQAFTGNRLTNLCPFQVEAP